MIKRALIISVTIVSLAITVTLIAKNKSMSGLQKTDVKTSSVLSSELQFGDIIFQSSKSGQSLAIQLATESKYSHVGMLFKEEKEWMVLEAVQPVKLTPLGQWITYGDNHHYVVKRLTNAEELFTEEVIWEMTSKGNKWVGKNYDIYFDWSDDELYCSELVWKLYRDALNVELGELRPLKDFNLDDPVVQKIMSRRYGKDIPLESKMISPGDMFACQKLTTVLKR